MTVRWLSKNDKTMVIRMFEYGFKKAKELSKCEGDKNTEDDETVIYIPKQLVMFIEENKNIKDELKMKLVFPDGQIINYEVPVIKCWEYDDKRIIEEKMYTFKNPNSLFIYSSSSPDI